MASDNHYVDPDPRFAECPRCGQPLRFVQNGQGGVYSCRTQNCGFTSARDAIVEALVFELHRTSRLLEDLARVAIPVLIQRELDGKAIG